MLELKALRTSPERAREALRARGWDDTTVVARALALDKEHRALLTRHQEILSRNKKAARKIGMLMRQRDLEAAATQRKVQAGLKAQARRIAEEQEAVHAELQKLLRGIPNIPHDTVPVGHAAAANLVVHEYGTGPSFDFDPLPHWVLAERLGMVDFARGAKVSGAGFPFYVGAGAKLQRALIGLFLQAAETAGYLEMQPPLAVSTASAMATGQLPDKEGQMYRLQDDDLYLIPTAEVPLTNYYRGEIVRGADLPIKVCGYTPCWRREAGSYGKHVRGLNRLHQFDKVEIVQITRPERSYDALESMVRHAEQLLEMLQLRYRRLLMCSGEMGFNQTKQYDLEVWSAGQQRWLEVSSVSNFETFQSNRLKLRYRPAAGGRPRLAHTLNGSALALPRIVAALLENHQRADGTVAVPRVLSRHAGMDDPWIIGPQP